MIDDVHPQWPSLLKWLALTENIQVKPKKISQNGYGLFALAEFPPSTPLFTIPANALINILTLSPHYPKTQPKLSAIQIISLHLALYRPKNGQQSSDPLFGPYISALPRSFEEHPLTWIWTCRNSDDKNSHCRILNFLPSAVASDLEKLEDKFLADWKVISHYLEEHPDIFERARNHRYSSEQSLTVALNKDFLWAWLNVNTRCIFHRLMKSRSDPDNLTLCPILDYANHISETPYAVPLLPLGENYLPPNTKQGRDFSLLSPASKHTQPGEEIFLRYGAHARRTLFVEYGFVPPISMNAVFNGTAFGEVDVQVKIEQLFQGRGRLGIWMKDHLMQEGYWGDWTLHSSPSPAHPSYRLITALQLYHILPSSATAEPTNSHDFLQTWRDTFLGKRISISPENERLWRQTLLEICESIKANAKDAIQRFNGECLGGRGLENKGAAMMGSCVETLWKEELYVAVAVAGSVRENVQF